MKTFLIRGVPPSIQRDSWWMDGATPRHPPIPKSETTPAREPLNYATLLAALIALADFLLWKTAPGLSLAIFGLCLLFIVLTLANGRGWGGLVLGFFLSLPLIEQPQTLSLIFWGTGVLAGTTWIALGGYPGLKALFYAAFRLSYIAPIRSFMALRNTLPGPTSARSLDTRLRQFALGWALPLLLGLVFLGLLLSANPVIENWVQHIEIALKFNFLRLCFWLSMALLIWPFLILTGLRDRLIIPQNPPASIGPQRLPSIINPAAIRRSLIMFNLLFAVQTLTDVAFLWGDATLPEGMTYATYAHRGAYPLLVTALLAGGFALIVRPFTDFDRPLRLILLAWMVQTMILVISSLLRLDLYIEIYGLTRLRLAALIWIALVACTLALLIWQIIRQHSAGWLLSRGALLGVITLYACMFLSFDRTIARYNLTHPVPLDPGYICNLGVAALPEILSSGQKNICTTVTYTTHYSAISADWREWGFRDWRVLRSLRQIQTQGAPL